MPANKKHLTKSPLHRLLKITAGFAGGYVITELFFMILIKSIDEPAAIISLQFAGFILWACLMILAFIPKSGLKSLGIYLLSSILLLVIFILIP
ncbi:hypothetical protein [Zunongwangia pacifica]|uniref:Uncharacterized protein n=1 Tax=Zunongwangia pacifica TaxID=2911062 RepID=A0A9X1ZS31_9FLAO|nr:hypothetical protein [Zunongwangia pacifica]MCL6218185.1 hypothetical protein [Zunongwangia pacifica]